MENKKTETIDGLRESILWNGDCLELMKNIPDKSVDMSGYGKKKMELGF